MTALSNIIRLSVLVIVREGVVFVPVHRCGGGNTRLIFWSDCTSSKHARNLAGTQHEKPCKVGQHSVPSPQERVTRDPATHNHITHIDIFPPTPAQRKHQLALKLLHRYALELSRDVSPRRIVDILDPASRTHEAFNGAVHPAVRKRQFAGHGQWDVRNIRWVWRGRLRVVLRAECLEGGAVAFLRGLYAEDLGDLVEGASDADIRGRREDLEFVEGCGEE